MTFGGLTHQTGTTENSYLFTGEQYDPNAGFYYLRARYMNPDTGRFVTTDPYQGRMHEPATLHKYIYANANPVNNFDPSGLFSFGSISAGLSIRNTLIGMAVGRAAVTHGMLKLSKSKLKWKGSMGLYTASPGTIAFGLLAFDLKSEPFEIDRKMKRVSTTVFTILFGGAWPSLIPGSFAVYDDLEFATPGLWTAFGSPEYIASSFNGPATYISASLTIDKSLSYLTSITLGRAAYVAGSDRGNPADTSTGFDVGGDILCGWSYISKPHFVY